MTSDTHRSADPPSDRPDRLPTERDPALSTARALSFGGVAALYDRARPGYPEELFDDIASLLPGPRVVEVGAGTGKATQSLVSRGLTLTCVEPDPAMAEILVTRCRDQPQVSVVVQPFEAWTPATPYDGLVSAQAWHWTDPEGRWERAAAALRPGGLLALFWHVHEWGADPVHQLVDEVYAAYDLHGSDRPVLASDRPGQPSGWPSDEISAHPSFEDLGVRPYRWSADYTSTDFTAYLDTTSHHRVLPERTREQLSADIAEVVDRYGGGRVTVDRRTDLHLGRRV